MAAAQGLEVPVLSVDADVIVPSAIIGREQYAARTIRPRIHAHLGRFLQPVGNQRCRVPWHARPRIAVNRAVGCAARWTRDRSIGAARGGVSRRHHGGAARLKRFVGGAFEGYATRRNHPETDGTSRLSPYLHFGQIGPHTVALAALESGAAPRDREAFIEELIVRRELAVNFVRFNPHYDRMRAASRGRCAPLKSIARPAPRSLFASAIGAGRNS